MSENGLAVRKINSFGDKTKKNVDHVYIIALFVFILCTAWKLSAPVISALLVIELLQSISALVLIFLAHYRLFFAYVKNRKAVIFPVTVIFFGLFYTFFTFNESVLTVAFIIVAGMGVSADRILAAGIAGNVVMIFKNLIMYLNFKSGTGFIKFQSRHYFFLGNDSFHVSTYNNYSSTDLAAHYFWVIAAYLWIRGKKITWGEIFALGGLNLFVYSLSASKTTLLSVLLLLFCSVFVKLKSLFFENSKTAEGIVCRRITKAFAICNRYSFLMIAAVCILLSVFYTNSNPFFLRLNQMLHWRLSLGKRGILENGIHWTTYGVYAPGYVPTDGYYKFLDCSYINILITGGILLLVFYLISMTAVQKKHGKYLYGAVILTVCAISCVEEHHLAELSNNMFILLLFADFGLDRKLKEDSVTQKKPLRIAINAAALIVCAGFTAAFAMNYYSLYKTKKELDRLDNKAGVIYEAVQSNLDKAVSEGLWQAETTSMSSSMYGEPLNNPSDYSRVKGISWKEATKDPKEHAYYSIYYCVDGSKTNKCIDMMLTGKAKELIGNGSVIIEYDVITGKLYSVWFSEEPGCYIISSGRNTDRQARLRPDVRLVEGYSTGNTYG